MINKRLAAALASLIIAAAVPMAAYADSSSDTVELPMIPITRTESIEEDPSEEVELTDISDASVILTGNLFEYTGSEITPFVTVKIGDTVLTEDVDYTLGYSNNIEIGTASVEITGIGSYTGQTAASFRIEKPVQAAVTNLKSSVNTESSYKLSWSAAAKAEGYEVLVYNSASKTWTSLAETTSKSYTVSGLASGKKDTYAVRAFRTVGGKLVRSSITKIETATIPAATKSLKITDVTTKGYTLKWSKVTGAESYEVYRYLPDSKSWKLLKKTDGLTYTISDRTAAQKNTYRVCAVLSAGGQELKGAALKKRFTTKPSKVTGFTYSRPAKGYMTFKWNKVSGASKYQIYYSASKEGPYTLLKEVGGTKTSLKTSLVPSGRKLYFKMRAVSKIDECTQNGTCSAIFKGITFNKISCNNVMNKYSNARAVSQVNAQGFVLSGYNKNRIYNALTGLGGDASYILYDIDSGSTIAYNAGTYFETASTVKMPYILYCLREMEDGSPTMDKVLTYLPKDYNGGSSWLKTQPFYTKYTIKQVIQLIGDYSDNCGYYMLQDEFGIDGYNKYVASLGCRTSMNWSNRWGYVSACDSAREWVKMWEYMNSGRYASFAKSVFSTSCAANFRNQLGNRYTVYEKSGWIDGDPNRIIHNETAVVGAAHPYVVICLSNRAGSQRMCNVAEISESIHNEMWSYYNS